jgi:hypothetical protein
VSAVLTEAQDTNRSAGLHSPRVLMARTICRVHLPPV